MRLRRVFLLLHVKRNKACSSGATPYLRDTFAEVRAKTAPRQRRHKKRTKISACAKEKTKNKGGCGIVLFFEILFS